jgi:hypothetical protein
VNRRVLFRLVRSYSVLGSDLLFISSDRRNRSRCGADAGAAGARQGAIGVDRELVKFPHILVRCVEVLSVVRNSKSAGRTGCRERAADGGQRPRKGIDAASRASAICFAMVRDSSTGTAPSRLMRWANVSPGTSSITRFSPPGSCGASVRPPARKTSSTGTRRHGRCTCR